MLSQGAAVDRQGLAEWRVEVQQLVEQKRAVERELGELKAQLDKAGFASLSHMRCGTAPESLSCSLVSRDVISCIVLRAVLCLLYLLCVSNFAMV